MTIYPMLADTIWCTGSLYGWRRSKGVGNRVFTGIISISRGAFPWEEIFWRRRDGLSWCFGGLDSDLVAFWREMKLLEAKTFPFLYEWAQNFIQIPFINDTMPPWDKLVSYIQEGTKKTWFSATNTWYQMHMYLM